MVEYRADRRCVVAGENPSAESRFHGAFERSLDADLVMAAALLEIHRDGSFAQHGCASAVEFALRTGLSRRRAAGLLRLGETLAGEPRAEAAIRSGAVTLQAAAIIGRVFGSPECLREDDDWLEKAATLRIRALCQAVDARIEGERQGERVVLLDVHVTEDTRDAFQRARILASRKARRTLSNGQALAFITNDFLERHDPTEKKRRERRVEPTDERPGDRYIPAAVRAEVLERSQDHCEFPGCTNSCYLQFAHVVPHKDGGNREAENLLRLCTVHHTLLDSGAICWVSGTAAAPVFRLADGSTLTRGPDGRAVIHPSGGERPDDGSSQVSEMPGGWTVPSPSRWVRTRGVARPPPESSDAAADDDTGSGGSAITAGTNPHSPAAVVLDAVHRAWLADTDGTAPQPRTSSPARDDAGGCAPRGARMTAEALANLYRRPRPLTTEGADALREERNRCGYGRRGGAPDCHGVDAPKGKG